MARKPTISNFFDQGGLNFDDGVPGHIFVTEFENSDLVDFSKKLLAAENNPAIEEIIIWVSSYGGNAHNALAMVDLLCSIEKPVFTVAYGKAMSAGCLLVASGKQGRRCITENSYMMIHEAGGGAEGKTQDVIQQAKELEAINARILGLMSDYTGKSLDSLKKLIKAQYNTDLILDANEAVKFGLVDIVGIPKSIHVPTQKLMGVFNPKLAKQQAKKSKNRKK
jgi:ATP-dependent Clp protease protease subunit